MRVVLNPVIASAHPAALEIIYNLYKQILIANDNPLPGGATNTKSLVYVAVLTINAK